jgi:polyhydroxyalkanoate synthesis repressor PhaR
MVSFREVKPLDKTDKSSKNERSRRIIKRYSNRKLYDTRDSRYVTLLQIAGMVRAGEDVQIIDNATKEDKTEVTLALIISEELKSQPRSVSVGTLRDLIHQRGEKLLSSLREGPIGRLIPGATEDGTGEGAGPESSPLSPDAPGSAPSTGDPASSGLDAAEAAARSDGPRTDMSSFEQWRHAIDERIRAILPGFIGFRDLQLKVDQLSKKVADLEDELARRKP